MKQLRQLLREGAVVVSIGARDFATVLRKQDVRVIEIDWRPPYKPDEQMARLLKELM